VIKAVPIQDKRLPAVVTDFNASNETLDAPVGDRKTQPFRRKARNLKTLRVYNRDEKHFVPVQLEQGVHKPSNFEYESASRFLSLDSRPSIRRAPAASTHLRNAQLLPRKSTSLKESECPKDRLEFYNTFSMLINLGSTKREKPRESKLIPYARQGSYEQEVWTNQCSDLIWLGLQAYISDRSLNQQDEFFIQQRDVVPSVIQEILCFKAKPRVIVDEELDDNICRLQQRVQEQRDVLKQVSDVLTQLDAVECLYPTRRALGKQHLLYVSDEFRQRLDALQLWMNIVHELTYKLEVMADVLLVEALQFVCWPGKTNKFSSVHVVCSRQASCPLNPFSHANDDDSDSFCSAGDSFPSTSIDDGCASSMQNKSGGNDERVNSNDNKRSVHFNLLSPSSSSPDTNADMEPTNASTPLKPTPGRQLGTFVLGTSSAVFDLNSRTSVYRHFVERSLKRSGMRKLLLSLKNLLENTLSRTRQALLGHVGNDFNFSEAHVWSALSREVCTLGVVFCVVK
jgi:mitogen-activated protein kinase kinase kinase 4